MRAAHAALSLLLLACLWQAGVWLFAPPRYILPSPVEIAFVFGRQSQMLLHHAVITSVEILVGLILGASFGAATALAIAAWPRAGRLVWPMILMLQACPVFVLAPILVVWLGFGMASKVAMTTIIIFFPVASAFGDGLRRTGRDFLDAVALTKATPLEVLLRLRVPLALPSLISGLRVAAPLAPLGAVIGEWVGASGGLGFVMVQANARMQTDVVFAAMALLAGLTLLLRLGVDRLTAGLVPWAAESEPQFSPFFSRRPKLP